MQVRRQLAVATGALIGCLGVPAVATPDGGEGDNVVLDWNATFIEAVQAESTPPGLAARNLAIFHLAIEKAVRDIDAGDRRGAAVAAAHRVATVLYPSRAASFDALHDRQRAGHPNGTPGATAHGQAVADRTMENRRGDGASLSVHYVPKASPGHWRRTTRNRPPELPQWPKLKPFVLKAGAQFRPEGPPAMDSREYAAAFAEVRRLGAKDSAARSEEQTLMARFWADFTYTSTPPGHWNEIARDVARRKKLELGRSARLFAILNVALADAGIAAFDCKYHHDYWRPITAIRRADEDQNDGTTPDPRWEPLLPTPSHPEYVSAHSTFSAAAAEILARFFGSDAMTFKVTSFDVPDVVREYRSFRACAEEIGMSRLYGGIHYRFSNADGLELGRRVAAEVAREFGFGQARAQTRSPVILPAEAQRPVPTQ